ncbi:hypothetical protein [Rhodobacter ferrooxidans]|uniref:Uncharacterized protein n=1 Tax=Rhodobacter ferrooxidans TaxID=371731 RepID=C8RY43_9RHOB|nr:hypothetical protein [Rhodobacter sp. SW2]EEW26441.1 hypothetical protein Rsw2DRAFT_0721 [Rhodobacter sp. SW2]
MAHTRGLIARLTFALAAAATLGLAAPDRALAQSISFHAPLMAPSLVTPAAVRINGFNWMSHNPRAKLVRRANTAPAQRPRLARQLGRGSYICSPAGFGKRSRCYSN